MKMSIKLFGLTWFTAPERAEYKKLKEESEKNEKQVVYTPPVEQEKFVKPYKSLRSINGTVICVLGDFIPLMKKDVDGKLMDAIHKCNTEEEIIALFTPKIENIKEDGEEEQIVKNNLDVFKGNKDFVVDNKGNVFLSRVQNFRVPSIVVASFIEVLEKIKMKELNQSYWGQKYSYDLEKYYNSLKMFTLFLALNPIESSREDLLKFIKNNDIKLTSLGNLILYRRANLVQKNNALVDFVSKEYFRVKKMKKSPKNYYVWKDDVLGYKVYHNSQDLDSSALNYEGSLQDLYLDLPNMKDNLLTDARTGKKEIRIGSVYQEDEDKIDIDSRQTCSRGLHCASRSYDYSGFGDTPLLVLVNPSKVRSVPIGEESKMRVSEMFIASILEIDESGKYMDEDIDIVPFDETYFNISIEELETQISKVGFETPSCQNQKADVDKIDVIVIKELLKSRINIIN